MGYVKGNSRGQFKICSSLDEEVGQDNFVRVIDVFVDVLDLAELGFSKTVSSKVDRPSYDPKDMLKLYIYGMENAIISSRKLEREAKRNIELKWLLNELQPDDKTICNFRRENAVALKDLFNYFCKKLHEMGFIGGKTIAIDGTKIRANNSKANNFSQNKLERHLKMIDERTDNYLKQLESNDSADESQDSSAKLTEKELKEKLEILRTRKEKYGDFLEKIKSGEVTEVSTTDPDSRMMSANNNGVDLCYNVQSAVDSRHKLIAAMAVSNNPADQNQLFPMANSVKKNLGLKKITALADKGYHVIEDLARCECHRTRPIVSIPKIADKGVFPKEVFKYDTEKDQYVCPTGKILPKSTETEQIIRYRSAKTCKNCQILGKCTKGTFRTIGRNPQQTLADISDKRFWRNIALYRTRQALVEHPFGTIKRTMKIQQFSTRGLTNVTGEVALIFLTYNLKRLKTICTIPTLITLLKTKLPSKTPTLTTKFSKRQKIAC